MLLLKMRGVLENKQAPEKQQVTLGVQFSDGMVLAEGARMEPSEMWV